MTPSAPDTSASTLWSAVSLELQQTLAAPTYSAWFGRANARSLTTETLEVEVPNEFVRGWISGHFMDLVTSAAATVNGTPLEVSIVVGGENAPVPAAVEPEDSQPAIATPAVERPVAIPASARAERVAPLNRNATFDTFV
ncbi:MAG: DnaA N-terminal domain-containing protein, partial [Thermoleophilia bacterium]